MSYRYYSKGCLTTRTLLKEILVRVSTSTLPLLIEAQDFQVYQAFDQAEQLFAQAPILKLFAIDTNIYLILVSYLAETILAGRSTTVIYAVGAMGYAESYMEWIQSDFSHTLAKVLADESQGVPLIDGDKQTLRDVAESVLDRRRAGLVLIA